MKRWIAEKFFVGTSVGWNDEQKAGVFPDLVLSWWRDSWVSAGIQIYVLELCDKAPADWSICRVLRNLQTLQLIDGSYRDWGKWKKDMKQCRKTLIFKDRSEMQKLSVTSKITSNLLFPKYLERTSFSNISNPIFILKLILQSCIQKLPQLINGRLQLNINIIWILKGRYWKTTIKGKFNYIYRV